MPSSGNTSKLFLILISLLLVLPAVEALDAGDTVAFLLGLAVSVIGFCACLGLYARKRNGQMCRFLYVKLHKSKEGGILSLLFIFCTQLSF
uniref:Small integral membrane protein 30 n=1 Tax=Dromaius novaehollandiae TaxID=8790 RepID=A0A8C4P2R0_DRONO